MKQEFVDLNAFIGSAEQYKAKLLEFYNADRINIEEIVSYKENGLLINSQGLNAFAVVLDNQGHWEISQRLYLIAKDCGSSWAKRNYAYNLIHREKKDFSKAITLLQEAATKDENIGPSCMYSLGRAHFNLEQYIAARQYFEKVQPKAGSQEDLEFTKARQYLTQHIMPETLLDELFERVGKDRELRGEKISLEDKPEKKSLGIN